MDMDKDLKQGICPGCKHYIRLWNCKGEHVGDEWHGARRLEHSEFIGNSRNLLWRVTYEWACNKVRCLGLDVAGG